MLWWLLIGGTLILWGGLGFGLFRKAKRLKLEIAALQAALNAPDEA